MKSKGLAIGLNLLSLCGIGGLHDFYCGKIWLGVIKLLTINFFWIGTLVDTILIACDSYYIKFGTTTKQAQVYRTQPMANVPDRISEEGICWSNGTDNQIDWAEDLVRGFMKKALEIIADAEEKGKITNEERIEITDDLENSIIYQSDANWWIDNRTTPIKDKMREITNNDIVDKL